MNRSILFILILIAAPAAAFGDWKITQKMKISGENAGGQATTIYQKGVRQRREAPPVRGTAHGGSADRSSRR